MIFIVDIKDFVEQLVKTGITKVDAEAKIKKMIALIKEKKGDNISDVDIAKLLKGGFARAASSTGGEKVDGIVIGYTPMFDKNKKYTENILNMYNDPAKRSEVLANGAVKFEKDTLGRDKMIIVDVREFIDEKKQFKNNNFGKEAKPYFSRQVYVISDDGTFLEFKGKVEPKIGGKYHINYRTFGKTKLINNLQQISTQNADEFWNTLSTFAETSDLAQTLDIVAGGEPYMLFLTTGFLSKKGLNTKNNQYWAVFNGMSPAQVGFGTSANEEVGVIMENTLTGSEVFMLVRARKPYVKDGVVKTSFDIVGLAVNPDAEQNNDLFNEMDITITE